MLARITVKGFKSLTDHADLQLPHLAVFFGPNAAGKSNLIDAVQALSRVGTCRTLADALQEPIRGYPVETFGFPAAGLPALLSQESAQFAIRAVLRIDRDLFEYRVGVRIKPATGALTVCDEYLAALSAKGGLKGNPLIQQVEGELRIRRKSKPAHPRSEALELNHTLLSDPRLAGVEYRGIEKCREELLGWKTYYLDPRVAMRRAAPPAQVQDIGVLGEEIAPFLYRLRQEKPKQFDAVKRVLHTLIPSVEQIEVDLDKQRGTLNLSVRQNGVDFSSRIISEGTLRVLALCAITVNPWSSPLMAFEEPENGVQPRRLELIAELLCSLAIEGGRQLMVTTHSPLFTASIIKKARQHPNQVGLFNVRRRGAHTQIVPFEVTGPLFEDKEIAAALSDRGEDGVFEGLALRGMLDE